MKKILLLVFIPFILLAQNKVVSSAYVKARIADSLAVVRAEFKAVDDSLASDIAALPTVAETKAFISDSVDLRIPKDISSLTSETPLSTDVVAFYSAENASVQKVALADLPVSTATQTALDSKVSTTVFNDTVSYFVSEIQRLEQLINTKVPVDTVTTPNSVLNLASTNTASSTAGSITLTYDDPNGDGTTLYKYIYVSGNGTTFSLLDSTTAESYSHTGLAPHDTTYYYYVRVSSGNGVLSNLDTAVTNVVNDFVTQNYYVSNVSAGDSTADSWTNKKRLALFTQSQVLGGDTVFVDGGADSLVYTQSMTGSAVLNWAKDGTSTHRIIITRDLADASHDGKPVFDCDSTLSYGIYTASDYVEFSYLKIKDAIGEGLHLETTRGVDFLHSEIDYSNKVCIKLAADCINTRIMYDSLYQTGKNMGTKETDCIQIASIDSSGYGVEIAHNYILAWNTSENDSHQDIVQILQPGWGRLGGKLSIHDNFMMLKNLNSSTAEHGAILYLSRSRGYHEIYNNVIIQQNAGYGRPINIMADEESSALYVKMYNNTIITNAATAGVIYITYADSLDMRNNIIYDAGVNDYGIVLRGTSVSEYINIDYNQYVTKNIDVKGGYYGFADWNANSTGDTYITWTEWQAKGYDANGEAFDYNTNPNDVQFVSMFGENIADYMLQTGSSGIDEGADLSSIFTDDILGTTRPDGASWDAGAIEGDSTLSAPHSGTLLDDFSDGDYTSNPAWTVLTGTGVVVDTCSNPLSANTYAVQSTTLYGDPFALYTAQDVEGDGDYEFDFYKAQDGSQIDIGFICGGTDITAGGVMRVQILSTESIVLENNGVADPITTAVGYVALNTYYHIRINRSGSTWTGYITGGAYSTETEMGSGASANATSSVNMIIKTTGAGDKITNIMLP